MGHSSICNSSGGTTCNRYIRRVGSGWSDNQSSVGQISRIGGCGILLASSCGHYVSVSADDAYSAFPRANTASQRIRYDESKSPRDLVISIRSQSNATYAATNCGAFWHASFSWDATGKCTSSLRPDLHAICIYAWHGTWSFVCAESADSSCTVPR